MKHVVHCSGYSLAERPDRSSVRDANGRSVHGRFMDWNLVCLGDPDSGLMGRIPMALFIAERLKAERLIWSTGATFVSQLSEADAMLSEAINYLEKQGRPRRWLEETSVIDRESTNTLGSMVVAAKIVQGLFGGSKIMLHLVTSDNHAPRVARDAAVAFRDQRNIILSVVPCHTAYGGGRVAEVTVRDLSGAVERSRTG